MSRWPAAWLAIVLSLCTMAAVPHSSRAEAAMPAPLPGDPAPSLKIGARLQAGLFDAVRPAEDRQTTVLVFFASWDPLSRTVLPIIDARQAALSAQGVRFLAIAEDKPEEVRLYLEQAKLTNLAVACDQGEGTLHSYRGDRGDTPIPYAVIIDAAGRLLWTDCVVDDEAREDPLAPFIRAVTQATGGQFDVAAARQAEVRRRNVEGLPRELGQLIGQGELGKVRARVKAAREEVRPGESHQPLTEALSSTGWMLLQDEPSPERVALGLEVVEACLAVGGATRRDVLHLHAQALFATGQIEAAVTEEQKAIAAAPRVGVFPNEDDCRVALAHYQQALAEKQGEPVPAAPAPAPAPPVPATLTRDQAQQDLRALDAELRRGYAGYDDTAWRLAGSGSSLEDLQRAALDRLAAQAEWSRADFAQFVNDYLRVYQDRHVKIEVRSPQGQQSQLRPVAGASPYFADLRVSADGKRMVVIEASDKTLIGRELIGTSVIDSPITTRPGETHLFPTLPRQPGQREYLLGVLSADAVKTVAAAFRGLPPAPDALQAVALHAHRGRVEFPINDWDAFMKQPPWSLTLDPLPVLAVRRLWGDGLDGLAETATKLRDLPAMVLDLRGNGGGADTYATMWGRRFTNEERRIYQGWANIQRRETDPLLRWQSACWSAEASVPDPTAKPYGGRLFALMDNGTCSSGESFATVAMGVSGALILGENSGGLGTYGNMNQRFTLPNSRLTVVYGESKFVNAGRPFREAIGFFPDYWLDTDDPVGTVAAYLKGPGAGDGRESKVESRE